MSYEWEDRGCKASDREGIEKKKIYMSVIMTLVVPSSYHKQPDGPFNAPEIIRGAAVTDILRLHIYMMYC